MLAVAPTSFVVAELTEGNTDALLRRMAWLGRDYPLARIAIVAARGMAGYRWLMREAGAVHFVDSPRRLRPLAELACRHLRNAPARPRTLKRQILDRLPWGQP
jgi:hypothetical protein